MEKRAGYSVAADELRDFVDRIEDHEREKADAAEMVKSVYAELKGRGYDAKAVREIIRRRKKSPEEISEHESIVELYSEALGMT